MKTLFILCFIYIVVSTCRASLKATKLMTNLPIIKRISEETQMQQYSHGK